MNNPTTGPSGGTPCRELLAAIGEALRLPPPATRADEISFHRLRSQRASVALGEINNVMRRSPDDDRYTMRASARIIAEHIAELKPTIYEHSPFGS